MHWIASIFQSRAGIRWSRSSLTGHFSDIALTGTSVTDEEFTSRPRGAIGFYLAGDTTRHGLGTVACVRGNEITAEHVLDGR